MPPKTGILLEPEIALGNSLFKKRRPPERVIKPSPTYVLQEKFSISSNLPPTMAKFLFESMK